MAAEFDEQLKQRLLAFQRHHGLAGGGVVDAETWTRLVAGPGQGSGQADPQLSPDGQWWWDGAQWLPAAEGAALLGSPGSGHAGGAGARDAGPQPLPLPLGPDVGPKGAVTPGPTSASTDDALTGFGTNSAVLTEKHLEVLARIVEDLNAHPLTSGGYVTLTGGTDRKGDEAANHDLGQRRAEAVRDYLQKHVKDDETRQAIRAYSLGEPSDGPEGDVPELRRVDIEITRRSYRVDLGPHPSQPLTKPDGTPRYVPKEDKEGQRYKHPFKRPDPAHPEWPEWFWKEVKKWPPRPSLISELSTLINQKLGTHSISKIVASMARAFGLSPAKAAELEKFLNEAFQEAGEEGIKKLLKKFIEMGAGAESEKPASPYGPTTEPVFPEEDVKPTFRF